MTRLTLVLLVDALRHDYVERTTALRRLAASGTTGRLREDFGFVPRAAYFGGLSPEEYGFTNMYCADPAASPFGVARGLPSSRFGSEVEEQFSLRSAIDAEARRRVRPFAAAYATSAEIPIELLPWFALTETRAPWDPKVGYRSIFHELDDRHVPYFTCAWPGTNALDDRSDAGIVQETLRALRPPTRFAFVHLQELDAVGHAFGPESRELGAALDRTDALVDGLVGALEARYDSVDLVLFGDHGMVSVTGTTDVWSAISDTGLVPGHDVVFFLDSTMARFWFPTAWAREIVTEALAPLGGRVLQAADLERLQLTRCDPRNGELIFLADPGVLVMPNFFQRRGQLVRGMHGYEPDCSDNQGLFLVRRGDADASGTDARPGLDFPVVVGPTEVYRQARWLLKLDAASEPAPLARVAAATRDTADGPAPGRYTQHPDLAAHETVASQLDHIVSRVREAAPTVEAVLVTGSFGRGEGGVTRGADGRFRAVNDYDILLVAPQGLDAQSAALRELGDALAREFDTDFVHFAVWTQVDPALPLTLANYDVRYGSQVLWGDAGILDALPRFAAADIPPFEGLQLLFNRLAGLLTGLGGQKADQYLTNQSQKALIALGDWHLLGAGAYDSSYRRRRERLRWLGHGLGLSVLQRDAIDRAYAWKVHPDEVDTRDAAADARATAAWLVDATVAAAGPVTRLPCTTPVEAAAAYYLATTGDQAWVRSDNAFAADTLGAAAAATTVAARPDGSVRQHIYASLLLVGAAVRGDARAFADAGRRLRGCLTGAWPAELTPENWELVRRQLAGAWLALVH